MTETSQNTQDKQINAWLERLAELLPALGGFSPLVRKVLSSAVGDSSGMLWWKSLGDQTFWVGISRKDAAELASESTDPGDAPIVLDDLLSRSLGQRGEVMTGAPAMANTDIWECKFADNVPVRFFVIYPPAHNMTSNLDVLMDIEMPVTLRFGSTHMTLQDIIGLNTGSVIELDRSLDDLVEVMVNGHVVARGDAVTVQGVYGIRISEIASQHDRLGTTSFAAMQPEASR